MNSNFRSREDGVSIETIRPREKIAIGPLDRGTLSSGAGRLAISMRLGGNGIRSKGQVGVQACGGQSRSPAQGRGELPTASPVWRPTPIVGFAKLPTDSPHSDAGLSPVSRLWPHQRL